MKKIKLGELGVILNGAKIPNNNGNFASYGGNGIIRFVDKWNFEENTIIIGRVGANCGAIHFSKEKCWVTDNALAFIPKKANPYFLFYIFKIIKLNKYHIGSAQPLITQNIINNIEIFLPDLKTQEKIANILSNIDDKIENNNKISAKLEQMAKLIYDYYFVQFDYQDENGKPYKSSGGAMKYNEILKREIPINWEVQSIAKNNLTKTIKPGVSFFEHKIYLATANVINSNITDGNIITYENRESRANMQPTLNSVWFAKMKNSIKHIFVPKNAKWFIDKYILSTGFYGLQCEENSFSYIYSVIKSDFFEKRKNILAHGATQEAVNQTDLQLLYFLIPENEVLKKYNNLIYNSLEQINNILKENQKLSSLRDFLLPMLMNGQVSFKN